MTLTGTVRQEPVSHPAADADAAGLDGAGSADEVRPGEGVRLGTGMLVAHDATAVSTMARVATLGGRGCSRVRKFSHGYSFVSLVSRSERSGRIAAALTLRMTGRKRYSVTAFAGEALGRVRSASRSKPVEVEAVCVWRGDCMKKGVSGPRSHQARDRLHAISIA